MAAGPTSRQGLTHSARYGTGAPTLRLTNTGPPTALEGFTSRAMPMGGFNERGRCAAHKIGRVGPCDSVESRHKQHWSSAHRTMTWARRCPKKNTQNLRADDRAARWLASE